jgi:tetratricopeptide (TPR) repeat protein
VISILLAVVLSAPNEPAERAERHFAAQEYEQAIDALREAYANEPDPKYVFAEGSALQELGRYHEAIEAYERFLALAPPKDQAQKAFDRIQVCRAAIDEREPAATEPVPKPESAFATEPVSRQPDHDDGAAPTRPWHRDVTGGVLLGVGLAAAATGGALVGVGAGRRRAAMDAETEDAFRIDLRGTTALQGVGVGLLVTGGALLVGAIVRYAIVRRRNATSSRSAQVGHALGRLWQLQPSTPG